MSAIRDRRGRRARAASPRGGQRAVGRDRGRAWGRVWGRAAVAALALACGYVAAESPGAELASGPPGEWTAERIMAETVRRHEQFPHVYEEQTMVLTDTRGRRTVRKCRRFTRAGEDGSYRFLLVFDDPEEIRGVALLVVRAPDGSETRGVYLPAFGAEFKRPGDAARRGNFLGTDLAVEDLAPEDTANHRYVRRTDRTLEQVPYFVVDAYPANEAAQRRTGHALRRHWVRQDNFVIARTDFYDRHLRLARRITRHDLRQVTGTSWRPNMVVAHSEHDGHTTLLKVDRRVYSRDYVPEEIFDPAFLLANGHMRDLSERVAGRRAPAQAAGDGS